MFLFDNPAVEIWACLAMFKLKSPTLFFWPLYIAWPDDRTNILTPVIGDVLACKNGSFEDLCNGCLNPNEIGNIEEMLKCCNVKQLGQSFVKWLQYHIT